MRIPFVDLAARHAAVAEAVERNVLEVLRSGRWVGGPAVDQAEKLAARWLGRKGAVGVGSGTDALILSLLARGVGPGHEVIVPALTFVATAGAVLATGARVALADVGEDGLLDVESARGLVREETRAVIPVHLFGSVAPRPELGLDVIDDAAQAIGADRASLAAGAGALTALSTYPTKTWGSAGDGGFVAGDDEELLAAVRRLGNHGALEPNHYDLVGSRAGRNSRLDAVQAAVLVGHAEVLERRIDKRRALALRYDRGLPPAVRPLPRARGSAVQLYCVRVAERDRVMSALLSRGIGCAVYYPKPLHHQPLLRACRRAELPVAERLCAELLALPIADVDEPQVDEVIAALQELAPWTP
jgi:dTDP-4-amino-4,6-dideoxygalactose transaminase